MEKTRKERKVCFPLSLSFSVKSNSGVHPHTSPFEEHSVFVILFLHNHWGEVSLYLHVRLKKFTNRTLIIMIKIIVLCLLFIYIALIGYRALGMLILTTINTSSTGIKTSKNELKD